MNDLSIASSGIVILIFKLLSLGILAFGIIKFKKKYLIVVLLSLVIWPFVENVLERTTSTKVQIAMRENDMDTAASIQMTGMVTRELIQSLLILSSAVLIFLNEKRANQSIELTRYNA